MRVEDVMANSKDIDNAAADWFAMLDRGELGNMEKAEFEDWINSDLAHRIAYLRVEAAWEKSEKLKSINLNDFSARVVEAQAPSKRALSSRWVVSTAAVLMVLVCAILMWYVQDNQSEWYRTPVGGVATVPLNDGSTITLNTSSEILVEIDTDKRRVHLTEGEVFFDVTEDPDRPFIVEAGERSIIVVGTKFSVWNDKSHFRVAVTEGHVKVKEDSKGIVREFDLSAGDIAESDQESFLIHNRSPEEIYAAYLSWREGFLVFEETPLREVVKELNRYNKQKLLLNNPQLQEIRIGGSFRPTNLAAFLRLLEHGFDVKNVASDKQVRLYKDRGEG